MKALFVKLPVNMGEADFSSSYCYKEISESEYQNFPDDEIIWSSFDQSKTIELNPDIENWKILVIAEFLKTEGIKVLDGIVALDRHTEHRFLGIALPNDIDLNLNTSSVGFGNHLEELKTALINISEYLRGINDPEVLDTELRTTRAYVDASLCFFDDSKYPNGRAEKVPSEIAKGVKYKLENIDPTKVSGETRGWIAVAINALKLLLSGGS